MSPNAAHSAQVAIPIETVVETNSISRREFLNYLLGGSLALLAAESCAAAAWFALPHLKYGVENGLFAIDPKIIPAAGSPPLGYPEGRFWLSYTADGLVALYMYRSFIRERIFYKWVPANNRFECPGCGSKFKADGTWIIGQGPARRNLDRYGIEVTTPSGKRRTSKDGDLVDITGMTALVVDTSRKIPGKPVASKFNGYSQVWNDSCQCVMNVPQNPPR